MRRTLLETKLHNWREKAKARRLVIEYLNGRIKELVISRNLWKAKYKACKAELDALKRAESSAPSPSGLQVKARRYQYPVFVIGLCIWLRQQGNCSLRTCSAMITELLNYLSLDHSLGIEAKGPCASTIQSWEQKMGYFRLHRRPAPGGKWAIIIDESVTIGQSKLLLTLGTDLTQHSFDHPLGAEDVEVLDLAVASSWKGEEIADRIEAIEQSGYPIEYGVSDEGHNLVKAFDISGIARISDCTHALSKAIEKCYKDEETFTQFSRACVAFKRKVILSVWAFLIPPTQKSKARFLNLHALSAWASQTLKRLEKIKNKKEWEPLREKISWIETYKPLIEQLEQVCQTTRKIFEVLKPKGLNAHTAKICRQILEKSQTPQAFKVHVQKYLEDNLEKASPLGKVIACSDIIESTFGKFKHRQPDNPYLGVTVGCLTIPNFGKKAPISMIKQAMEATPIQLIEQWKEENLINPMKNHWSDKWAKIQ